MSDFDAFLDDDSSSPAEEAAPEAEVTPETDEATPPVVEETTEQTASAKERALEAELARIRARARAAEEALNRQQEEEKPYLGEEYENRFKEVESKFQQQLVTQKLDMSEAFARDKYTDYQEKLDVFSAIVESDPTIYRQMLAQPNPAEFAYKVAANHLKAKEMGNPLEYEEKLKARLTAEIEQKVRAQMEAEAKKRGELPVSIADTRGAAGTHTAAWSGPPPLNELLG